MAPSPLKRRAIDIWGDSWDLYEERPTEFGFSLLLGRAEGTNRGGSLTLIVTDDLANHLRALAELRRGHSLPIGNTTIKKARRLLGIDWRAERASWWDERFDDLAEMSVEEFAATHDVSVSRLRGLRRKLRALAETG